MKIRPHQVNQVLVEASTGWEGQSPPPRVLVRIGQGCRTHRQTFRRKESTHSTSPGQSALVNLAELSLHKLTSCDWQRFIFVVLLFQEVFPFSLLQWAHLRWQQLWRQMKTTERGEVRCRCYWSGVPVVTLEQNRRWIKMQSEIIVFVYGTLKRGQPQNHTLMDTNTGKAELITQATTCRSFPLVISSSYNIPFLLNRPGTGYVSTQFSRQFIVMNFHLHSQRRISGKFKHIHFVLAKNYKS